MLWKKVEKLMAPAYAALLIFIIILIVHKDLANYFSVDNVRTFVMSYGPYSMVTFVVIMIFFSIFETVPYLLFMILGGFLFGTIIGALLSLIGVLAGSILLFLGVRKYGREKFARQRRKIRQINWLNSLIKKDAVYAIYIAKFIPILPNEILVMAAAFSKIKLNEFIVIMFIGVLPMAFITASIGNSFANPKLSIALVIFAVITSISLSIFLFKDRLRMMFSNNNE